MRGPRELPNPLTGEPLSVEKTLNGKELLVLGGTGFLGKVTLSMLLARYPGVGKIHILVRRGRFRSAWARMDEELLGTHPFKHFWQSMGLDGWKQHARTIFEVIDGDITLPGLGMPDTFWAEKHGRIAAIFNISGVVDFNPPLDEGIDVNCRGISHVLAVARTLGDIPVLHTSTCYVAGNRSGTMREDAPDVEPFPRWEELGGGDFSASREVEECVAIVESVRARSDHADVLSLLALRARERGEKRGEPQSGAGHKKLLADERRKWVKEELVNIGVKRAEHWGYTNTYT